MHEVQTFLRQAWAAAESARIAKEAAAEQRRAAAAKVAALAATERRQTAILKSIGGLVIGTIIGTIVGGIAGAIIYFLVLIVGGLWMNDSTKGATLAETVQRVVIVLGAVIGAFIGWLFYEDEREAAK